MTNHALTWTLHIINATREKTSVWITSVFCISVNCNVKCNDLVVNYSRGCRSSENVWHCSHHYNVDMLNHGEICFEVVPLFGLEVCDSWEGRSADCLHIFQVWPFTLLDCRPNTCRLICCPVWSFFQGSFPQTSSSDVPAEILTCSPFQANLRCKIHTSHWDSSQTSGI